MSGRRKINCSRPVASIFFLSGFLFFNQIAFAAGQPTAYVITLKSLELKNSAGQWVLIVEPDHPVDLLKNEPSISFFNNGRIPAGDYVNFRLSISDTIKVSGSDGPNRTCEGGRVTVQSASRDLFEMPDKISSVQEAAPSWTKKPEGFIHVRYGFDGSAGDTIKIRARKDFEPFAISKGAFLNVEFSLDFKDTVSFARAGTLGSRGPAKDLMLVLPPKKVEQAVVTVDQTSRTFGGDDLLMEF